METVTVRRLPFEVADGPANMAADEVLLESAAAGTASLRFYAWEPATLSLGYFQPESVRHTNARLAALPFVRRPSGGATLVHHFELTYALALPAELARSADMPWLCRMHNIIAAALKRLDVKAHACACEVIPSDSAAPLCFQKWTPGDLVLANSKIVGSAQRRQRGALLQHGAILLAQSPSTPELPGLRELAGGDWSASTVRDAIQTEFALQTNWPLLASAWTEPERRRRAELVEKKYAQSKWNCKR